LNYLGHLFLSAPDEDSLLGSMLGDFVKGPLAGRYPEAVARAIAAHRALDVFTDSHPSVQRSKARISRERRRYAGIMIDMFYDHFLARDWLEYHHQPLPEFSARIYSLLERRHAELPDRLQRMLPNMKRWDWFSSYAEVESIDTALNRLGQRLTRSNPLFASAQELRAHYTEFEQDFRGFLPLAMRFVNSSPA
jgi:acyl carrier protein phosphodiesterase